MGDGAIREAPPRLLELDDVSRKDGKRLGLLAMASTWPRTLRACSSSMAVDFGVKAKV